MAPKQKSVAKKRTSRPTASSRPSGVSFRSEHEQPPPVPRTPAGIYGIRFRDAAHETICNALLTRHVLATRFLDSPTMATLGLFEDVQWMFNNIGWNTFFTMIYGTFIGLTLEFFGSLDVKVNNYDDSDEGRISFRLGGRDHTLTLTQINRIFGFPEDGSRTTPREFNENIFWSQISSDYSYAAKKARASAMSNPVLRYVHRFLAHTIFGRGESDGMVRLTEVYFLWAMIHSYKVNTAYFMVKQMIKVAQAKKGAIVMGGLVTQIARALDIDLTGLPMARGNMRIDLESCIAMRFIVKESDSFWLIFKGHDTKLLLPNQARTTVRDRNNFQLFPPTDEDTIPNPISTQPAQTSGGPSFSSFPGSSSTDAMMKQVIEMLQQHGGKLENIEESQAYLRHEVSQLGEQNREIIKEQKRQAKFMSSFWDSFTKMRDDISKGFPDDDIRGDGDDDDDEPEDISSDHQEEGAEMSTDEDDDDK